MGKTVITYGTFDLFHIGHLNLLRHAKSECDHLIAGVVSDEMLREVKGVQPVVPHAERMEIVRSIAYVDEVWPETLPDKLDTWQEVRFTHFFKGDDWRGTDKGLRLEREFAEVGVEVVAGHPLPEAQLHPGAPGVVLQDQQQLGAGEDRQPGERAAEG